MYSIFIEFVLAGVLFYLLTPKILGEIPSRGSFYLKVGVHSILFSLILLFGLYLVKTRYEGMEPTGQVYFTSSLLPMDYSNSGTVTKPATISKPSVDKPAASPTIKTITSSGPSMAPPTYQYIGCFKDSTTGNDRAIPNNNGTVKNESECQAIAQKKGASVYGLQDGNQCWTGTDLKQALKYGSATDCGSNKMGGFDTNSIYVTDTYLGCYKDSTTGTDRAIPNNQGTVKNITDCQAIAVKNGANVYGLQSNGQCWTGTDIAQSMKYGPATDCGILGGFDTNQVYLVKK